MQSLTAGRVLIIEDDEDTRANLRDLLELDGHTVLEAATAAQGLSIATGGDLLAIILDRRLPDAPPSRVLAELRRIAPEASVIVVTGFADLEGAIAALRLGAADYILKPLNPEALRASLGRVSERLRLEEARHHSEAAFRNLLEAAESVIVITRTDLSILYLSPFAERLTGYSTAEVRDRDMAEVLRPIRDPGVSEEVVRRLRAGEPVRGLEDRIVCRDGSLRAMIWNAVRLADYEGESAFLAVGQDITGLRLAQERALQSERLAAIGQMVTGLAHESRNALQRSQACLEMLALEVQDRPAALALIARLQAAQDHLAFLYEDVRAYAAPLRLDRRLITLSEIWRGAWAQLVKPGRPKEARLVESFQCQDLQCEADPFRMGQVFRNIFENSLAAASPPAEVRLRCSDSRLDDGAPALEVSIRDNGPGLTPEARLRLFEPFFTTKIKGTGLGMALAHRIVESHGGKIAAGVADGPGAEIRITLPRARS